jgi:hypothetical protein
MNKSGKDSLLDLIWLSTQLNKKLTLIDDSIYPIQALDKKICEVNLSVLFILMHGHSWYNQYGFISDNYQNELAHNKALLDGASASANSGNGGVRGGSTSSSQANGGNGGSGLVVIRYYA